MKRIHIIGSGPRTGTTLLAEIMHTCFDIDHHCEHEAPISTSEPPSGNIFLTKQPGDILSVGWPLRLNRNLHVICIIRDPRDSIVSAHGSRPGEYWTGLRYWKAFVNEFDRLNAHPRFFWLRYEDLVSDPDHVQALIADHLPFLRETCKFSEYHLHARPSPSSLAALKGVRPIAPVGIGSWKNHLPRVKQQIRIHGGICQDLKRFGYEEDCDWERDVYAAEDRDFRSDRPEHLSSADYLKHRERERREVANILIRGVGLSPDRVLPHLFKAYRSVKGLAKNVGGDRMASR